MMTEEEAQEKWCPHVRQPQFVTTSNKKSGGVVGGCNSDQNGNRHCRQRCITGKGFCGLAGKP